MSLNSGVQAETKRGSRGPFLVGKRHQEVHSGTVWGMISIVQ